MKEKIKELEKQEEVLRVMRKEVRDETCGIVKDMFPLTVLAEIDWRVSSAYFKRVSFVGDVPYEISKKIRALVRCTEAFIYHTPYFETEGIDGHFQIDTRENDVTLELDWNSLRQVIESGVLKVPENLKRKLKEVILDFEENLEALAERQRLLRSYKTAVESNLALLG